MRYLLVDCHENHTAALVERAQPYICCELALFCHQSAMSCVDFLDGCFPQSCQGKGQVSLPPTTPLRVLRRESPFSWGSWAVHILSVHLRKSQKISLVLFSWRKGSLRSCKQSLRKQCFKTIHPRHASKLCPWAGVMAQLQATLQLNHPLQATTIPLFHLPASSLLMVWESSRG